MIQQEKLTMLKDFFAAYFHQDFFAVHGPPEKVVAAFVADSLAEEVGEEDLRRLSKAIKDYAQSFDSDNDLERSMLDELGCYYSPKAMNQSARVWMLTVASWLLSEPK